MKGQPKTCKGQRGSKWKISFQRSTKNSKLKQEVVDDPSELQRVSYATSIDNLPERPSAFKQVLKHKNIFKQFILM